jgi:anti-sigma B factor antagonist
MGGNVVDKTVFPTQISQRLSARSLVSVGCSQNTVWVKVEGRGTFQNSGGLKTYAVDMIQQGYRRFVVDLEQCEMMDSTFMGMLTSISLRLRDCGDGGMEVVGASPRTSGLLANLGLDQLFSVKKAGDPTAAAAPLSLPAHEEAPRPASAHEMLAAHEALAEAAPANAIRFRDVLELLQKESTT